MLIRGGKTVTFINNTPKDYMGCQAPFTNPEEENGFHAMDHGTITKVCAGDAAATTEWCRLLGCGGSAKHVRTFIGGGEEVFGVNEDEPVPNWWVSRWLFPSAYVEYDGRYIMSLNQVVMENLTDVIRRQTYGKPDWWRDTKHVGGAAATLRAIERIVNEADGLDDVDKIMLPISIRHGFYHDRFIFGAFSRFLRNYFTLADFEYGGTKIRERFPVVTNKINTWIAQNEPGCTELFKFGEKVIGQFA